MCTIVLLQKLHADFPVIIAGNRDEFYARPTGGPRVLDAGSGAVGGIDEQAGGTWMGVTPTGLFVGLTNQRSYGDASASLRSRGEVVLEAMRRRDPAGVRAYLEALDPAAYNPFNLVFGDAAGLHVAYARRQPPSMDIHALDDGVHVLPNDYIGSPDFPKCQRAMHLLPDVAGVAWPALWPLLVPVISDHALPEEHELPELPSQSRLPRELVRQLQALCIHTPLYGTRSATVVALAPGRVAHYLYADGPPCTAPLIEHTDLLTPSSRA